MSDDGRGLGHAPGRDLWMRPVAQLLKLAAITDQGITIAPGPIAVSSRSSLQGGSRPSLMEGHTTTRSSGTPHGLDLLLQLFSLLRLPKNQKIKRCRILSMAL